MNIISKKLIDFCVYSSLIVSIGCGFLTFGIIKILLLPSCVGYAVLNFFGTFIIYNIQRIIKLKSISGELSDHLKWVKNNFNFLIFSVMIASACSIFIGLRIIHWNLGILALIVISVFLSITYTLKIRDRNLREIPHLKIHLIALVWVVVIAFFPLMNEGDYNVNKWIFGSIHYFYLLAICIPFDIRDLIYDNSKQKTIPQIFGIQKAKVIGITALILFTLIALCIQPQLQTNILFYCALIAQLLLLIYTNANRKDYYFGALIDGAIILLGMSYIT